jgi:predicted lipase
MNNIYGAIGTTVTILLFLYIYLLKIKIKNNKQPVISQSMLHYRYSTKKTQFKKIKSKTQSMNHYDKVNVRVILLDNYAYWIKDNVFYKAPLMNELIDKDSAEQVDTMGMDKIQLDKMLFIMDKLREGIDDDSRGSGNK